MINIEWFKKWDVDISSLMQKTRYNIKDINEL